MEVKVRHPYRKDLRAKGPIVLMELLRNLEIDHRDVIVLRNGITVNNPHDLLIDDDIIEIYPVISGG